MMSNMSSISGPPGRRKIDPPRHVWVNLPRLFPVNPHHLYSHTPHGLQLGFEGAGLLLEEVLSADGSRLGLVRFQLLSANREWQTVVTQYVPQHCYRPRSLRRGQR
jgi:hypothetical protein